MKISRWVTIIDDILGLLVTQVRWQAHVHCTNVYNSRIANFTLVAAQLAGVGLNLEMEKLVSTNERIRCKCLIATLEVADKIFRNNISFWFRFVVLAQVLQHLLAVFRVKIAGTLVVARETAPLMTQLDVILQFFVRIVAQLAKSTLPMTLT